jgi:hypothetical protein
MRKHSPKENQSSGKHAIRTMLTMKDNNQIERSEDNYNNDNDYPRSRITIIITATIIEAGVATIKQ